MPANPRQSCIRALLEWEKGKFFSDEILHTALDREALSTLDRAFLMETFFGVLRNLSRLDFLIGRLREGELDPETRSVLRLGLYQVFHMRTADHAAVNETVNLAGRARGLVNAILRRALREKPALEAALAGAAPAIASSHPEFLLARWRTAFGPDATARLCAWNNQPAEVHVRANELRIPFAELLRRLPGARPSPAHPLAIRVDQLPLEAIAQGLCYVQDPSTLLACDLLDPQPGENVLDACAAPGGKTTYLAQLMRGEGRIIACDLYESRVARLRENVARLGATIAQVIRHDCMQAGPPLAPASFDRILVDAPCSNTGVIRRRVDVRWRLTAEDFLRMPAQQLALLRRTATLLKSGGALVYSTCSLEAEENDQVVERALAAIPGLRFLESRRLLPFADGVDGAFAAKFTRE
ncbi:MAG: 16S rRNA (cytosine(967)-C(5))-methyltransferase RsmB [Chthoniobacter sp.]|nr:16S rRNA (cytosine(967)-C(5))-methyltransferase RsmB [Chthoniobacter sp.]